MKYAVVKSGGKQYRVAEGDIIEVERLKIKPSEEIFFDKVLLFVDNNDQAIFELGRPYIKDFPVKGKVLAETKGEKIRVVKFKSKVRYRRTTGHRQLLSRILIEKIGEESKKPVTIEKEEKIGQAKRKSVTLKNKK